jgi:hypothetical protein
MNPKLIGGVAAWVTAVYLNEKRLRKESMTRDPSETAVDRAREATLNRSETVVDRPGEAVSGPTTDEQLGRAGMPHKPFKLNTWLDTVNYASTGWSVIVQGQEIHVYGPRTDDPDRAKPYVFVIQKIPRGQWTPLLFRGLKLPIAVNVQPNDIYAQWLPLTGRSQPAPPTANTSQDSRMAFSALTGALRARGIGPTNRH